MSGDQSAGLQGPLEPGQKVGFGRYTLTRFLGKGGMGVVWLARDDRLEEELALKFLAGEISHDAEALGDMRRETLKSRKLSHPNIIRIHDLFEGEGELPFISMEFIDGKALNTFKAEQPHRLFSWGYLMPLVRQLCAALDYAHGQKIIHRDLKPGNMMVDSTGALKLADFGLAASAADSMSRLSKDLGSSGTPPYMSPQQLRGQPPKVTDDIYSLGATLYELLTSKPPFYTGDIPYQVREEAPTPMDERLADLELDNQIPDDVADLVMACLAKEPERRPPDAAAVAEWIGLEIHPSGSVSALSVPAEAEAFDEEAVTVPAVSHDLIDADAAPEDPENEPASERSSGGAWKWGAIVMALLIVGLGAIKFIPDREPGQSPEETPHANADAPSGAIDLMPLVDVSKDAIKGTWELKDSRLISRPFKSANLELPYHPPEEYDFHVTFTRQSGEKSVEMILSKNGRSFVWSMGGFDNTKQGFYFAGRTSPADHLASLSRGIESGRKYDVVVQVRNNVVRSIVDGALAVEWPTDYTKFQLTSNWQLRDDSHIGVGNDNGHVVFERVAVCEVTGKGEFTRVHSSNHASSRHPQQPVQTIDLLALTDPVKDRISSSGNFTGGSNLWIKSEGRLSFRADGKPGKIAAPVAMTARGYEIELIFDRKAVTDRFHIDLPVNSGYIVPLAIGQDQTKIVLEGVTIGEHPPLANMLRGRVVARIEPVGNSHSKVTVTINGQLAATWSGDLAVSGKAVDEPHPEFPNISFTSIWCRSSSYEFTSWKLRVLDGQAKQLRPVSR